MNGTQPSPLSQRTAHGFKDGGQLPVSHSPNAGRDADGAPANAAQAYNPKRKLRMQLPRAALAAVRRVGLARIVSGGVSIFLLLSVFSAITGLGDGSSRKPIRSSNHLAKVGGNIGPGMGSGGSSATEDVQLEARKLLPVAPLKIPAVQVDRTQFVQRQGAELVLGGRPFRFTGASNYYVLTRAVDPATRAQVAEVFGEAKRLKLNVLRVWAFCDGDAWNALQPQLGQIDEHILSEGLDWVIGLAKDAEVRLILTLTDSQGDYGGMSQYVRWNMPLAETIKDFYTSRTIRKSFKDFVGTVIAHKNTATGVHYRDEPTIMAWEIANAPVCPGDDSGDILQDWIEDISMHVKALDPNHLVMLGHSGVFGASTPDRWYANPSTLSVGAPAVPWAHAYDAVCEGADWGRNHAGAPHVDVASIQLWVDDWLVAPEPWKLHWSRQWIRAHADVAEYMGKPMVISAFSKQRRTSASTMAHRNQLFDMVLQETQRTPIIAGSLFWLLASNSYPDYDGYTVYTSAVAAQQPVPAWPPIAPEQAESSLLRRQFMNWEAMMVCGEKRAQGNTTANKPIDPARPDLHAWIDGWADVLDVVNSHAQAMATLSGIQLSKAALSHDVVPRRRHVSQLLPPNAPAAPLQDVPLDYQSPEAVLALQSAAAAATAAAAAPDSATTASADTAGVGIAPGPLRAASQQSKVGPGGGVAGEAPAADVADRELDGEDLDAAGVGPATEGAERDSTAVRDTAEGAALGDPDFAPVVNVTEASAIDFDDEEADAGATGLLARLSSTLGLGSMFGGQRSDADLNQADLQEEVVDGMEAELGEGEDDLAGGLDTVAEDLTLDEAEDEAQAAEAEAAGILGSMRSWLLPASGGKTFRSAETRAKEARSVEEAASVLAQDSLDEAEDSLLPGGGASTTAALFSQGIRASSGGTAAAAGRDAAENSAANSLDGADSTAKSAAADSATKGSDTQTAGRRVPDDTTATAGGAENLPGARAAGIAIAGAEGGISDEAVADAAATSA